MPPDGFFGTDFLKQNLTSTKTLPGPLLVTYDAPPNSLAVDTLASRLDA